MTRTWEGKNSRKNCCAFVGYRFTQQLLELDRVSEGSRSKVLLGAAKVVTPLIWQRWEYDLREHPDRDWVKYMVSGFKDGFRLGCDQSSDFAGKGRYHV